MEPNRIISDDSEFIGKPGPRIDVISPTPRYEDATIGVMHPLSETQGDRNAERAKASELPSLITIQRLAHRVHRRSWLAVRVMVLLKLVVVVDDDESVRESLPDLLRELGYAAKAFASAEDFLASDCISETQCLILDIAMPGMSGPELKRELIRRGHRIQTVFITAVGDKNIRASLLRQGAVACLFKPFSHQDLSAALATAIPQT